MPAPALKPPVWDRHHDWSTEAAPNAPLDMHTSDVWGERSRWGGRQPEVQIEVEGEEEGEAEGEGLRRKGGFLHGILNRRGPLDVQYSQVGVTAHATHMKAYAHAHALTCTHKSSEAGRPFLTKLPDACYV